MTSAPRRQTGGAMPARQPPGPPPAKNMAWIPGGEFTMGSEFPGYTEEWPPHRAKVDGFWMDEHTVTNAEFRRFVNETGYITVAERPLDPEYYPNADRAMLV